MGRSLFFTADEHYGHNNIIKYDNRPFEDIEEMHLGLIARNNAVVRPHDYVIHCGDFSFLTRPKTLKIIPQLSGNHIFIKGDHDKWLGKKGSYLQLIRFHNDIIVAGHWAMRSWPFKHYGAYHTYGHSHGKIPEYGKSMDVGVSTNDYYPVNFQDVKIHLGKTDTCKLAEEELSRGTIVDQEV